MCVGCARAELSSPLWYEGGCLLLPGALWTGCCGGHYTGDQHRGAGSTAIGTRRRRGHEVPGRGGGGGTVGVSAALCAMQYKYTCVHCVTHGVQVALKSRREVLCIHSSCARAELSSPLWYEGGRLLLPGALWTGCCGVHYTGDQHRGAGSTAIDTRGVGGTVGLSVAASAMQYKCTCIHCITQGVQVALNSRHVV